MQGQQLGKYVLDELIAVGGMAEIYRARTASGLAGVEKLLAIKRLHPHYCSDRDFVEMLVDEARIAMQLNHKNIGQVFDLERSGESFFLAMEYIHGRDLFRVIRRFIERGQLMPLECACFIATEICSGLSYAHRRSSPDGEPLNIVHRDISPQNVLVSFEGEVKIVDFGIAKAAKRASITQSGVIKGKFYYMSPEQARGDRIDQRTDLFSIGAILYEMATGRMLYEGEDDARLIHRARRADYQPPSVYTPDIPPQLEQIILKALSRDVHQRFATARDMQLALTSLAHGMGWTFDSVMLSDQMHLLFDASRGGSDVYGALPHEIMARPDYAPGDASVTGSVAGFAAQAEQMQRAQGAYHDAAPGYGGGNGAYAQPDPAQPPAAFDEEAATQVYGDEIGRMVDQIDAHYDAQRGGQLQRASVPDSHREVDIQVDDGAQRRQTVIGPAPTREPQAPRQGPPPALIATGVAGLILLLGAFIFAATQLLSSDEADDGGPRLEESAAAESAAFAIHSEPAGARIFIDGKDTGLFTPANLSGVGSGTREITLKLRHHDDLTQKVPVESSGAWSAELTPKRGILRIDTTPPGAAVHVDGEAVGTAPVNLDNQLMSEPHTVAAALDGHKDVVRTVHWVSDEPILDVRLSLVPADLRYASALAAFIQGAHHNVVGAVATPRGSSAARAQQRQGREPSVRRETPSRSTRASREDDDGGGRGKISVASKPPGEVYVDGKPSGKKTPLKALPVTSGYHKIKVRYSDGTYSGEKRALIKPGAEVKLFFRQ